MKFAQTNDGIKIAYATRGEGPLTLLFLHGWSGSGAYFDETFKYLDLTGLRAVTFDLRGHGDSDQPMRSRRNSFWTSTHPPSPTRHCFAWRRYPSSSLGRQ